MKYLIKFFLAIILFVLSYIIVFIPLHNNYIENMCSQYYDFSGLTDCAARLKKDPLKANQYFFTRLNNINLEKSNNTMQIADLFIENNLPMSNEEKKILSNKLEICIEKTKQSKNHACELSYKMLKDAKKL